MKRRHAIATAKKLLQVGGKDGDAVNVLVALIDDVAVAQNVILDKECLELADAILFCFFRGRNPEYHSMVMNSRGVSHRKAGRLRQSLSTLKKALGEVGESNEDASKVKVDIMLNISGVLLSLGQPNIAYTYSADAIKIVFGRMQQFESPSDEIKLESKRQLCMGHFNLGSILNELGAKEFAFQALTRAEQIAEAIGEVELATISKEAKIVLGANRQFLVR